MFLIDGGISLLIIQYDFFIMLSGIVIIFFIDALWNTESQF